MSDLAEKDFKSANTVMFKELRPMIHTEVKEAMIMVSSNKQCKYSDKNIKKNQMKILGLKSN